MNELEQSYTEFWDDLLREADDSGEPQQACFFKFYSGLAAENGDCCDLEYTPVKKDGSLGSPGYQVDGYALDPDSSELFLVMSDFRPERTVQSLNQSQINSLCRRVERFYKSAIQPAFIAELEETSSAFEAAYPIHENKGVIKRVRVIIFSNARLVTRKQTIEARELDGKMFTYNILDFTRFVSIQNSRNGSEPLEIDLSEINNGSPLPCLKAYTGSNSYASYLVVMPGELLSSLYGLYGPRLLEQNVRTFLQAKTKVNRGIIQTIENTPEMFFAYNNGLTATASGIETVEFSDGIMGIKSVKNLQIVNGGQTTASVLYARDRSKADLEKVFVQMKLSVIEPEDVEVVVPKISRYANTQNRISEADFFSNHPFHITIEKISRRLSAPQRDGHLSSSKWFYERARGQYKDSTAYSTPGQRRTFEKEYPKDQVIVKTDLAKYALTFDCQPHTVCLGAQKCFMNFAEKIGELWDTDSDLFNDGYFRNLVAKAIIFRWTDRMVSRSEWYREDRGYKAQIVTYTIAWLVNHLKESGASEIDLELIWNEQNPTEELQGALEASAYEVGRSIKDAPPHVKNIGEYCKQQACWSAVSRIGITLPHPLGNSLIERGEATKRKKEDRAVKKIDRGIEFETLLIGIVQHIDVLMDFARERKLLSPKSHGALQKLKSGNIILGKSEQGALKQLFQQLEEEDFEFPRA